MKTSPGFLKWSWRFCAAAILCSFAQARAQPASTAPAASAPATSAVAAPAGSAAPASSAASGAAPAPTPAAIPTIFVCGDSTANSGGAIQGWGTPIASYFDKAKVTISNVAQAGTSSRTFYNSNWTKIVPKIKSGDYVLIVFGINDGLGDLTGSTANRSSLNGLGDETGTQGTQTVHTYGWYMAKMATEAKEAGAHVYFLTVTVRDIWTNPKATFKDATILTQEEGYDPKDDKIERGTGSGQYTQWTKDIGAKLHLPVLDLTNLAADKYEKMGREKVMVYYSDHNHTFPAGADIVAQTIVSGLKAFKNSPFTALLSDKGKAVETADAKYVAENLAANKAPPSVAMPTAPAVTFGPAAASAK